jgi:hypothetical protein
MANTTNQGHQVKDRVKDAASTAYDKTKDAASTAFDKTKDAASTAYDKTKDAASAAYDKASEFASQAADRASDMAHRAGERADSAAASVGSGMKSLAGSVRDNTPNSGMLGSASDKVADTLEGAGRYLEDRGLSGMADDLTGLIKRNPIPAVLIGIGIGYLIARSTRS